MPKLCAHRRTGGASRVGGGGPTAAGDDGDSGCTGEAGDSPAAAAAERLGTDLEVEGGALRGDLLLRCW